MDLLSPRVTEYLQGLVPARPERLARMEAEARAEEFPIIGPVTGQLCYLVARLCNARRVFELGSGFGYSTAWFARAVRENGGGEVHHTVWDEELSRRAREHLAALGLGDLVRYRVAEAVGALAEAEGRFDLVFNDIDKHAYPESLAVVKRKLRPGGVLLADNALWHGRIFDAADRSDDTEGIRRFTDLLSRDDDWTFGLVPVRDGLLLARLAG